MLTKKPAQDPFQDDDPDVKGAERMKTLGEGDSPGVTRGIRIVGEIRGDEDLTIAGEVAGSVFLPRHQVRVVSGADVQANITARVIEVEGRVLGDLRAGERIVIRSSSVVDGDIVSPQIQLEEGCEFKGSVQMQEPDLEQEPPVKQQAESTRANTPSSSGEE